MGRKTCSFNFFRFFFYYYCFQDIMSCVASWTLRSAILMIYPLYMLNDVAFAIRYIFNKTYRNEKKLLKLFMCVFYIVEKYFHS